MVRESDGRVVHEVRIYHALLLLSRPCPNFIGLPIQGQFKEGQPSVGWVKWMFG
jgi:hypothetical protein